MEHEHIDAGIGDERSRFMVGPVRGTAHAPDVSVFEAVREPNAILPGEAKQPIRAHAVPRKLATPGRGDDVHGNVRQARDTVCRGVGPPTSQRLCLSAGYLYAWASDFA